MKKFSVITSGNIILTAPNLDRIVRVSHGIKFVPLPVFRRLQAFVLCSLVFCALSYSQIIYQTKNQDSAPVLLVYLFIIGVAVFLVYKSIKSTGGRQDVKV
jgi:hypothetical protein